MSQEYYSQQDTFAVVHPQQDVRQWHVFGADGLPIGQVHDMLFNTETERVEAIELTDGNRIPVEEIEILEDRVRLAPKLYPL